MEKLIVLFEMQMPERRKTGKGRPLDWKDQSTRAGRLHNVNQDVVSDRRGNCSHY